MSQLHILSINENGSISVWKYDQTSKQSKKPQPSKVIGKKTKKINNNKNKNKNKKNK